MIFFLTFGIESTRPSPGCCARHPCWRDDRRWGAVVQHPRSGEARSVILMFLTYISLQTSWPTTVSTAMFSQKPRFLARSMIFAIHPPYTCLFVISSYTHVSFILHIYVYSRPLHSRHAVPWCFARRTAAGRRARVITGKSTNSYLQKHM